MLNNLEHVAFATTWLRSSAGDEKGPWWDLLDAMNDPILGRLGVLPKLHTLELAPSIYDRTCSGIGAALIGVAPSLRALNLGHIVHPPPASGADDGGPVRLPFTRLSILRLLSCANMGNDLYQLCRRGPNLEFLSFQLTYQIGSLAEKALSSCAGTLRELHVMYEGWVLGHDLEPVIPLDGLPHLTRLETLYIDMSNLLGQSPWSNRTAAVNNPDRIEELLACGSLRKLHVFNNYALAKRSHGGHSGCRSHAAGAVLENALLRPLLAACDKARLPHMRLVSVRTPIIDGGLFAREMVHAFAEKNKNIGFVMFSGTTCGSRSWCSNTCCSSDAGTPVVEEDVAPQRGEEEEELDAITKKMEWPDVNEHKVMVKSESVREQDYIPDRQGPLL